MNLPKYIWCPICDKPLTRSEVTVTCTNCGRFVESLLNGYIRFDFGEVDLQVYDDGVWQIAPTDLHLEKSYKASLERFARTAISGDDINEICDLNGDINDIEQTVKMIALYS